MGFPNTWSKLSRHIILNYCYAYYTCETVDDYIICRVSKERLSCSPFWYISTSKFILTRPSTCQIMHRKFVLYSLVNLYPTPITFRIVGGSHKWANSAELTWTTSKAPRRFNLQGGIMDRAHPKICREYLDLQCRSTILVSLKKQVSLGTKVQHYIIESPSFESARETWCTLFILSTAAK